MYLCNYSSSMPISPEPSDRSDLHAWRGSPIPETRGNIGLVKHPWRRNNTLRNKAALLPAALPRNRKKAAPPRTQEGRMIEYCSPGKCTGITLYHNDREGFPLWRLLRGSA